MTDRISRSKTSPSTAFFLEADLRSQSGANSVVRCYLRCVNTGDGTSNFGGAGVQVGYVDTDADGDYEEFGRRSTNPFLPSGVAGGATRWRLGPFDVTAKTGSGIRLRMRLDYGSIDETSSAVLVVPPPAPTPMPIDQITPTGFRFRFSSAGTGGATVTEWQVQIDDNPAFGSPLTIAGSGTTLVAGLHAGVTYYARARGRNATGWGPWSAPVSAKTLAGMSVGVGGGFPPGEVHVGVGGTFPLAADVRVGKGGSFVTPT